jgi:hypothetical protein
MQFAFLKSVCYTPRRRKQILFAGVAQLVEHLLAKEKVAGSNPVSRSNYPSVNRLVGFSFGCKNEQ